MNELRKATAHFKKVDQKLFLAWKELSKESQRTIEHKLSRRLKAPALFEDICWTIIGQQLSGKAANTIFSRFKKLCGRVTPGVVSKKSIEDFRAVGISYAKGRALHDLASKTSEKTLLIKRFESMSDEEVVQALVTVRGVGPWTAEMTLMFSLGRPDVFSAGDLGLQKSIQQIYNLKKRPSRHDMDRLSKKWSPYRTYASLILWRHLDSIQKNTK